MTARAVRLVRVQHAIDHGAACFHVENLREFFGIVAGHHDLAVMHLMEHVLTGEELLGQFREREGDESVQLGLAVTFFFRAAGHYDAACADVQSSGVPIVS